MEVAVDFAARALYLVMILSLPPILTASITGLLFSLIQAVTQLQEQTLSFGVKLLAVGITLFAIGPWICSELLRYSEVIFANFYLIETSYLVNGNW